MKISEVQSLDKIYSGGYNVKISHDRITLHRAKTRRKYNGSSTTKKKKSEKKSTEEKREVKKRVGGYKLNKSFVRDKINAFFHLRQSKKFCAFYSVSFPAGIDEKTAVECFNIWRTRLKNCGLRDYIRVCEHQKNGTIHFHLLVNVYLPIRVVNGFMAIVLRNKGLLTASEALRYNGVDVKYVRNKKYLGGYLTKYVTKNNEEFDVLPYHSSRSVSALFTSVTFNNSRFNRLSDKRMNKILAILTNCGFTCFYDDYCEVIRCWGNSSLSSCMKDVFQMNEELVKNYD